MKIEVDIYSCYGAVCELTPQELETFTKILARLQAPQGKDEPLKPIVATIKLLLA